MSVILSLTGISIFIRINLWLKFALHLAGLICFSVILKYDSSIYQIMMPQGDSDKQWISNVGFDPIISHFYYVFMIFIILLIIDRQIEYIFRLDFKLFNRLNEERLEAKMMAGVNDILLKNILPLYVVKKYLNSQFTISKQEVYSESYKFCVVMFASIPNFSEFYSESKMNENGRKCLQVLNEIICDFDQVN